MKRLYVIQAKPGQKGSAFIEFALCLMLFWTPLFLGTYQIGFNLVRAVQVTQICRDGGHMYSQGLDFSASSPQALLASLMPSALQPSASGRSLFYFSKIIYVDATACSNGGLQANTASCPNYTQAVITQQIPVGNLSLGNSKLGTAYQTYGPSGKNVMDSSDNIPASTYLKDPALRVSSTFVINLSNAATVTGASQVAYVSELYVSSSDLMFWKTLGTTGEYAQSVF